MYRIALVQNQSEMAHYGYADAQGLLQDFGYSVTLFTAQNVQTLQSPLRASFDGLFLGSNCLNDKTIRAAFREGPVCDAVREFLRDGGGLLSMHQLGMASITSPQYSFLPDNRLERLSSVARPLAEEPQQCSLRIFEGAERHILLRYPNTINAAAVQQAVTEFRSLPGVYWHYWDQVNLESWDTLVEDASSLEPRALVVATKQSSPVRAVFSALTLDWQRQRTLLENLLRYTVEGRHSTAVLSDSRHTSVGFEYLLESLASRRFPYRRYSLDASMTELARYLREGVHTTLLLAPFVMETSFPPDLLNAMEESLEDGQLRVMRVAPPSGQQRVGSIQISSRQRFALALLQQVELKIQAELRAGYIDGSFWSTAETLQTLEKTPLASGNYSGLVHETLIGIERHERNGSYDGVFGATCAACWLRATYLGADDPRTRATLAWIRAVVQRYEDRERALAYTIMLASDVASEHEKQELVTILSGLSLDKLSQSDLVAYIRAALALGYSKVLPGLLSSLCTTRTREAWIDLATGAEASSLAQDAMVLLKADPSLAGQDLEPLRARVDDLVFSTIVEIQDSLDRSDVGAWTGRFPWDGKASTAAKCLETWLKFDATLDLPVYDAVEVLEVGGKETNEIASGATALSILEELKNENEQLREASTGLLKSNGRLPALRLHRRLLFLAVAVSMYLLVSVCIGVISASGWKTLRESLSEAFVGSIAVHFTVLGLLAAYAVLPWRRWLGREE